MLSLDNISVYFGGFVLLENVSLQIGQKERIGLVGRNGAGKTTLMKILTGLSEPSKGKVVKSADASIGYLPQQMVHNDGLTVYEETMKAFSEILGLEKKISELNREISERTDYHSADYLRLIDKLSNCSSRYDLLGGNTLHADVEKTLTGLGFDPAGLNRQTREFSGGWRMRIELAKILLRKPQFILLDEPTNHLDIESIQWLEEYLSVYPGSLVLISHDRAFLDKVTNRTVEINMTRLIDYKVSYSKFVKLREERRQQEQAAFQNQQKMIKDTEEFIERFRYKATKAVQVQSRIKQLEKLDRLEIEQEEIAAMHIKFPPAPRSGREVVRASRLSKSYGNNLILSDLDLVIERGEKVAFVGKNGEGKTTLSKIIASETEFEGELKLGHNVDLGYFAQNQDELLDENKTVLETIDAVAVGDVRSKIRDILGAFLFSGEDVDKKVKVLSGGERSRLSLARLLLQTHNLILMDEPTNHLDMRSKDILKNALLKYDGTLIVVSHDRDFLDGLVDKVFEFRDKKIKEHLGGIYDFLSKRKLSTLKELERKTLLENSAPSAGKATDNKDYYFRKKEFEKNLRKLKNRVEQWEGKISSIETELKNLGVKMEINNPSGTDDLFSRYGELQAELKKSMEEWEKAHLELEELEGKSF